MGNQFDHQFGALSVPELIAFAADINAALVTARERERIETKQKLDAIIASAGLTIEDVADLYGFNRPRGARKGTKAAPKYCNPDNHRETWAGRGRQPRWLVSKLAQGAKPTDFAI